MTGARRSPAELADAAHEAVRALNHQTLPAQCELADHLDLFCVLGSLAALLHATPQALRQAADWIVREQQHGTIGVDNSSRASPADTVAAIVTALSAAGEVLAHAARRVDRAHQAAAHLIIEQPTQLGL